MMLTEYLTKWPEVYCIPNKEAIPVSRCLKKLVGRFGVPEIIISDQGREFCNELNDNFCSSLGIARHAHLHSISSPKQRPHSAI